MNIRNIILIHFLLLISVNISAQSMSQREVTALLERTDRNNAPEEYESYMIMRNYKLDGNMVENETHCYRKGDFIAVIFTSPAIQQGQVFLRNEDDMWMYLPRSRKLTRIGAKDQSAGGEASNTDILRLDLVDDYNASYLGQEMVDGVMCYKLELTAKNRTIAYDRVLYWISVDRELPVKREYYALSGMKIKTMGIIAYSPDLYSEYFYLQKSL